MEDLPVMASTAAMTMIRRSVVSSSNGRGAMWPGHVDTGSAGDLLDAYSRRIAEGLAMRCGVRVCDANVTAVMHAGSPMRRHRTEGVIAYPMARPTAVDAPRSPWDPSSADCDASIAMQPPRGAGAVTPLLRGRVKVGNQRRERESNCQVKRQVCQEHDEWADGEAKTQRWAH